MNKLLEKKKKTELGFTLIELLIVITILAVLTGVALLDYGFSVKKARIQVAAEELVALLGDATVRSQTQFSQIEEVDGADSTVVCYGVTIEKGSLPVLFKTSRDEDTQLCVMSDREPVKELSWEDLVFVTDIDWTAMTVSGTETDTVDWIAFLFSPPKGDVSVYLDSGLLVEKSEVTEVQVRLTYQNSSESVLNKVVKINPVTSSFMILTQSEVEAL
ncbi:MAG: prepilin-type N-terminal cleavage/methylation domain-containing protein [Candidatus Gracilibacteria bacterium]|jgi:prepilin-type N-terminal cleavage/methylation domain-containing protein